MNKDMNKEAKQTEQLTQIINLLKEVAESNQALSQTVRLLYEISQSNHEINEKLKQHTSDLDEIKMALNAVHTNVGNIEHQTSALRK